MRIPEKASRDVNAFFQAIQGWGHCYGHARLHYVGIRQEDRLHILLARLFLAVEPFTAPLETVRAGHIEAGMLSVNADIQSVQQLVAGLASDVGMEIPEAGCLRIHNSAGREFDAYLPSGVHPEGAKVGSRFTVLTVTGETWHDRIPQPDTDWLLRGGETPYDSFTELVSHFGLANITGALGTLEVFAHSVLEVWKGSAVTDTTATVGLLMAPTLAQSDVRIGFRVLDKGSVVNRGSIPGTALTWQESNGLMLGKAKIEVHPGSVVQCIASLNSNAHHIWWIADQNYSQNPRFEALKAVDPSNSLLREYLWPDAQAKGKKQDDFEAAISWMLWVFGFSPCLFGTNPRSKDAFDIIACTPGGDFVVVECTLGLLKAESKLSKLGERAANLRSLLSGSTAKSARILPVIVSAMSRDQLVGDLEVAAKMGVYVVAKEELEQALGELNKFPDANSLFEQARTALAAASTEVKPSSAMALLG